jgi:hypothetical protein
MCLCLVLECWYWYLRPAAEAVDTAKVISGTGTGIDGRVLGMATGGLQAETGTVVSDTVVMLVCQQL